MIPDRAVATTALVVLADLADRGAGSASCRRGIAWLCASTDERGRVGHGAEADWIESHAIAVAALAEALRSRPGDTELRRALSPAAAFLASHLERPRISASPLLATWALHALVALERARDPAEAAVARRLRRALERHVRALRRAVPADDIAHAAALWDACHDGRTDEARETLVASALDRWRLPSELDPLVTMLVTSALYRAGGTAWRTWALRLTPLIALRGPDGAWPAVAPRGLTQTAALHALTLSCYYRYCGLATAQ